MRLTKAQRMMVEDGFPSELFKTREQRERFWEVNPPRQVAFTETKPQAEVPEDVVKLLADDRKRSTARLRKGRSAARESRDMVPGARWNPLRCRWEHPQQIAKEVLMAEEEKTVAELTVRYNEMARARNPEAVPVKRFKDRATALARIEKLQLEPIPAKPTKPTAAARTKKPREERPRRERRLTFQHGHGDVVELFDFTPGNDRERLLHVMLGSLDGYVPATELGDLESKMGGVKWRIDQKSLPFEIKFKREGGVKSYGLFRR